MLSRTLIPDFQASAGGDDRRPHVLAGQALAHLPGFVEHRDRAVGFDLANEMNPSGGQRQRIRQVGYLGGGQAVLGFAALCLSGRVLAQQRRRILGHIPVDKGRTGPTH